jgi:antitoxin component of MazEF toxin-antitoxin module
VAARVFRATLEMTMHQKSPYARVPIAPEVVEELGLRPGETLRASVRGTEFTGKVHGSLRTPGLLVPIEVVKTLGLREGQGVRVTVLGRAG